jgi:aconitate hydratase
VSSRRRPASCPPGETSEHLARTVFTRTEADGSVSAYLPRHLRRTDSHTTMVNGLGVLGWGVGGTRAEDRDSRPPVPCSSRASVGFKLTGAIPPERRRTDVVLTITQMLRAHGVVGKIRRVLPDRRPLRPPRQRAYHRQHVAGIRLDGRDLPNRRGTLDYLRLKGRADEQSPSSRPMRRPRGCGTSPRARSATTRNTSNSTSPTVVPSIARSQTPAGPPRPVGVQGLLPHEHRELRARRRARGRPRHPRRWDRDATQSRRCRHRLDHPRARTPRIPR